MFLLKYVFNGLKLYNVHFHVSCFLLFFTSCFFTSYTVSRFLSPEIKINELRKKQEIHNKKYDCQ